MSVGSLYLQASVSPKPSAVTMGSHIRYEKVCDQFSHLQGRQHQQYRRNRRVILRNLVVMNGDVSLLTLF